MSINIVVFFLSLFVFFIPLQAFSQKHRKCGSAFLQHKTMQDWEIQHLKKIVEHTLERNVSNEEAQAFYEAYMMDSNLQEQLRGNEQRRKMYLARRQINRLKQAGISKEERQKLRELPINIDLVTDFYRRRTTYHLIHSGFSLRPTRVFTRSPFHEDFLGNPTLRNNLREGNINEETRYIIILDKKNVDTYDDYSSRSRAPETIGKVLKKISDNEILVEMIDLLSDNPSKKTAIINIDGYVIGQGNPELATVFRALDSRDETDSISLNIPSRTQEAKALNKKGFGPVYTRGLDEVNEWIAVADQLRKANVDPNKTHISYFADKIAAHIIHLRKLITSFDTEPEKGKALEYVKQMETEAEQAINEKQVTYQWWINFNYKLSQLGKTPSGENFRHDNTLKKLIHYFPMVILMPTSMGEIGVIAMNRALPKGIYPLGLALDVNENFPTSRNNIANFFTHDIQHTDDIVFFVRSRYFNEIYTQFHDKIMEKTKNMRSMRKRKHVEIAYFLFIHEFVPSIYSRPLILSTKREIASAVRFIPEIQNTDLEGYVDLSNFENAFYETLKKISLHPE